MIQSIGNIVRNGIESMSELPESNRRLDVTVEVCRMRCMDGDVRSCTVLRIEDRGCGIPGEANEKIFNPFYTTRPSGTGLGLAIAHRVVDAHGGHITVNGREGGGTQFEVCFPAPGEPGDTVDTVKELSA
jgi:signal transduction histidine kinase